MKVMQFEGSPEEFKAISYLFQGPAMAEANKGKEPTPTSIPEPTISPIDAIRVMLKRRPISEGQMALYKALSNGQISHPELLKRMGRSSEELAGVCGALGRRINQTPEIGKSGLPSNLTAVTRWEQKEGKWYLELTSPALEALKLEGVI